jgi:Flp pilus assembly protein TadG
MTAPLPCRGLAPRLRSEPRERGSGAVELVLLTPVLLLVLMLVVGIGRLVDARERVGDAAYQAARAATLTLTAPAARQAATSAAASALSGAGVTCAAMSVSADVGTLAPGSTVSVSVTCTVSWAGITGISFGAHQSITGRATSVVDEFRSVPTGTGS